MKYTLLKIALLYTFVLALTFSCSKKETDNEIIQVKYGISFGECIGYCKRDLTFKSGEVTYNNSSWIDTIKPITCSDVLDNDKWNYLKTGLDIEAFFTLSKTIGCPDCADGGAEWIEIELSNGKKHKVAFEYRNEPSSIKGYVIVLRGMMEKSEFCGENK